MQRTSTAVPKIRHKDGMRDRVVVRMVTKPFVEELVKEFGRRVEEIGCEVFDNDSSSIDSDVLLANRKHLVSLVRSGMYERKDLEVEIATQAMIVWWLRGGNR